MTNELQTVGAMHQCRAGEPYSTCVHCGALAETLNKPCPHFMRDAAQKLAAVASPTPQADSAPTSGKWVSGDDVNRLVRELDVALNGKAGAAAQASLCDVVAQVRLEAAKRGQPLLAPQADSQPAPVRNLQWTQDTPPTHGICSYDHCTAQTPLGPFRIEWKSWKEHDARCLYLNGEYIGCAASTDDAKQLAQGHIESIAKELAPYRAARAPADSVTAPATEANWEQLRSALAMLMLGWGRNPNQTMDACYRVLDSATEPGTALEVLRSAPDWRDFMAASRAAATTPPAQAADSVLEDAARWQFVEPLIGPGKRTADWEALLAEVGKHPDTPEGFRAAVDAARKQGGAT